jgi:thiol-disulfide isomerase/thioredoxin
MRQLFVAILALTLVACTTQQDAVPTTTPETVNLESLVGQPAPELHDAPWLNTAAPLKLADLRGKVVMLHFWSYDCISCQFLVPVVNRLNLSYAAKGLVVIGDHFPTHPHEHKLEAVSKALPQQGITYPVILDNDAASAHNSYRACWGTLVLIDKQGIVRYTRAAFLEESNHTRYDEETEVTLKALLAESYP